MLPCLDKARGKETTVIFSLVWASAETAKCYEAQAPASWNEVTGHKISRRVGVILCISHLFSYGFCMIFSRGSVKSRREKV